MPVQKQAKIEDKKMSNVCCATVQMVSDPVGIYEYTEINMVGVFAGISCI